ncbi:hypothetical protein Tco_0994392 [Tanacetum coccineum]
MRDEHLDTVPATESDEEIKSSVEDLVPIPSESEGIPEKMCDVPLYNNPTPLEAFEDHYEIVVNSNDDNSSSDDDSPYGEDIDYVDASPLDVEIVSLEVVEIINPEVGRIDDDILLTIKDDILREKLLNVNLLIAKIEALRNNPTPSSDVMIKSTSTFSNLFLEETNTFDNSIPESETFFFDLEENSSGSTTTHSELSLPDYKAFYVDNDHIEEKSSGSTTTHADFSKYDSFIFDLSINPIPPADRSDFYHEEFADELAHIISLSEYDHFCFKIDPELGNLTMDVDCPDRDDSRARGFVLRSLELHILKVRLLKKARSKIARRDQRIQAKKLETLLEAEVDMKKAVEAKNVGLAKELESLRAQFAGLQIYEDDKVKQRCAEMDARLDKLSVDFDEELYPHMLTAIAGHRLVIGHGMHLAVMKCAESSEIRHAFANVVYTGLAKGMSEGLKYGIEHGKADRDLADIEAYDLEANKSNTGEDAPQWIRDLRPSSSQLKIPVYPEVRDPEDPWAVKEEMLLDDAIAANISRAEKKKKCRVVCRTHGIGSAHHTRSDGIHVSAPIVVPQGLAILLADAAT